ncbi:Putative Cyclic nucleotide-binding, ABC transporter and Peptidase C39, bacteriocin processing [Cupriavidus taiwanensis]|uniref:Cyclolysin secretion/processing ATP-binding protein CyaB n=1 Tax=Cupriavidus taiwanensis TaxID=164546 RepID=A0A976G1Q4_9BURK|nr:peptidase domain-containing ABC transporter [Cupriavidus taiwanensis]SOZ13687.1 Putative Cyclic nucleotide-binding, ABC transporter and Peptidase C39, bacteriocin processing [Cupriavidus taiwanensis]SOZ23923.1 Putative Cyclic nucleotide-binding, ABC transporter and Peptidase C39, bacteriocin processing [Cupriavidus taiwanensis]SOZ44298.1 Putative Cyclic nucleotide-binding, ABC transporter and Peptidase C39, bacteriocin processing [Cupriavidus taiwanensis]SOZ54682.1 Putative Cyclic nucleotide
MSSKPASEAGPADAATAAPQPPEAGPALAAFLASVEILSVLTPEELARLADAAQVLSFGFGDTVCNAGEAAPGLFIVKSGSVRVFNEEHGKEISMGVRKTGEVFADLALLREYRHESSVRASGKTELLMIPRTVSEPVVAGNPAALAFITSYVAISSAGGFVARLFDLRGKLDKQELEDAVRSVGVKRVAAGREILKQDGREDRRLYVVRQGTVRIVRSEEGSEFPLATLGQGDIFGERACVMRQEQLASAIAETDVRLLVIPEKTVQLILERNPRLREVLEERIRVLDRELHRQKKLAERRKRPVLLDLASKPELGEKLIRRFALVEQAEEMDCGAACLAMICRHYGIPMTLGKLRELANVTTQGATLDSLARAGESLGFTTRGVQCTRDSLMGFELPFIVHWEGYHYVVVYGISSRWVWVADPAIGFRKMSAEEFERGWSGTCLLFTPGESMTQLSVQRSPWLRFIGYLAPYKKILAHLFLATFVIQMLGVVPPLIIQNILDGVVVHQNVGLLHLLIAGLIISSVFSQLMSTIRAYLANFMVRNMDFAMMSHFFRHTLSLPLSFFAKRKTGDIFARFQENQTIRAFLTESTVTTALNLLMVFIYFTIMFLYNVKLTLLLIAFVIPIAALTVVVTPRVKTYARDVFATSTDAKAYLMETLGGAETVKGMGIERPVRLRWERKYTKALESQYKAQQFHILVGLASQLLNAATTIAVLWVGATLVLERELTIGQLMAFNAFMGSVLAPLMGLVALWGQLNDAGVAMERLGDVLDLEPEQKPQDVLSRVMLPDLQGEIVMKDLYFRYGGEDTPYVLENISFAIRPGEMVAIVGRSGSGKTTLAKLLVGFYKPTEGSMTVDGYDLNVIDAAFYRAQVGYVMQSNLLFSGTIAENIACGDDSPDRRRIEEVARMADAHAFISKLPLGYEQVVGERGIGLSGGQIQRLCIARALYHDPRLLVFDEATSALDTQSESNILANMQEILRGRTAVIIAHRLSTIMQADKILVLYEGAIVEQGRHEELLERKGMYFQLVQKQLSAA